MFFPVCAKIVIPMKAGTGSFSISMCSTIPVSGDTLLRPLSPNHWRGLIQLCFISAVAHSH